MGLAFWGVSTEKSLPVVADEKGILEVVCEKIQKNNSAQVGQNFENQLPDNLSGIKNRLPTKLVGSQNHTFVQVGRKLKITSTQLA